MIQTMQRCGIKTTQRRATAFTLIELMVVLAVIAILMAMVIGLADYLFDEASKKETQATQAIVMDAITAFHDVAGLSVQAHPTCHIRHPVARATG